MAAGEPLMVCVGGNSCAAGSQMDPAADILFVDTDRRSVEDLHDEDTVLVGDSVVHGEGSGGNLNLARACFKKDMEMIAERILNRPLVIILADASGSTSVAGSVEMNSLLARVGMPSLVLLMTSRNRGSQKEERMAEVLMNGPLRPGVRVDADRDDMVSNLKEWTSAFFRASSESAVIMIPSASWNLMRENGGPFGLFAFTLDDGVNHDLSDDRPLIAVMDVPGNTTNSEVKEKVRSIFSDMEGVSFGIVEDGLDDVWKIYALAPIKGTQHDRFGPRSTPPPTFEEMMGEAQGPGMGPGRSI